MSAASLPFLAFGEPITFTRHENGQVTVGVFPEQASFSGALLRSARRGGGIIHHYRGTVVVTAENGAAVYEIACYDPYRDIVGARRIWHVMHGNPDREESA